MMTRHSTQTATRQQESIDCKSVSFPALFLSKNDCKTILNASKNATFTV